jgi:hypothetical protein
MLDKAVAAVKADKAAMVRPMNSVSAPPTAISIGGQKELEVAIHHGK